MTPNELFTANQQLVYYCYHTQIRNHCPPDIFDDVIQEGFLGLWQACMRFDESKGFQFPTFAVPYVVGKMRHYIREQNSTIRISRTDWDSGDIDKYATLSLEMCISDDNDGNLGDLIPGCPDEYEGITEDLIDSFIEHERARRYKSQKAQPDAIERDLAVLEEYLYGKTFFEYPGQEALAQKYQINQASVSRAIKKGRQRFREFMQTIDNGRTS